jgi:UPF0271 protein
MKTIDLNADIGEAVTPQGIKAEAEILRYVSSANIACGGHAGSDDSMRRTVKAARDNNVVIGAHPGYPDPENFGRKSLALTSHRFRRMLMTSLIEQIVRLAEIAADEGCQIAYVKPHGALYNDAVKNREHAETIAKAITFLDPSLMFLGGPNSQMGFAADRAGLKFVSEGFIDRRYTDDGHLQHRAIDGAVIENQDMRLTQAKSLASTGQVITASGETLTIEAKSLCLHGDSAGAVETARQARSVIEGCGVKIRAFAHAA